MIRGVFYYRFGCPYCWRFDKFVLEPLEMAGVVSVRRINADLMSDSSDIALNRWVASAVGATFPVTPLLIVFEGPKKVVFSIYAEPEFLKYASVEEEVAIMARSFVKYVVKKTGLPEKYLYEEYPLVKRAVMAK